MCRISNILHQQQQDEDRHSKNALTEYGHDRPEGGSVVRHLQQSTKRLAVRARPISHETTTAGRESRSQLSVTQKLHINPAGMQIYGILDFGNSESFIIITFFYVGIVSLFHVDIFFLHPEAGGRYYFRSA